MLVEYMYYGYLAFLAFLCLIAVQQLFLLIWRPLTAASLTNQHVVITGGSQGLGLSLGQEFVRKGARVTLMARSKDKLADACKAVEAAGGEGAVVAAVSVDVTDAESIKKGFAKATQDNGPVDVLVTCAGFAPTGFFDEVDISQFRKGMELNYFGTVNTLKAVVPTMKERKKGRILFVSSGAALTGYVGYSAYAPTKWAVRGLADSLRNELQPYGITVHNAYPPNMDTPGYKVEQTTKPAVCKEIEEGETLYTPEVCAAAIVNSLAKGEYHISCGDLGINLLASAAAGMSPRNNFFRDIVILPIAAVIGYFVVSSWDSIARKHAARG